MSDPTASETTEEGNKTNVTEEASIPPQLAVLNNKKHPLEHAWCFWYARFHFTRLWPLLESQ